MSSVSQAVLLSWSIPPAASFALALTGLIYLRGWFCLWRGRVPFVPAWRAVCFLFGLLAVWVALASPLDTFSGFLITAHMLQHILLMMAAPPLLLLGAPVIPLVRGLPVFARREFAGPFLNWRLAQRVGAALTNLWLALILMGLAMFAWHTPRLYELALASSSWHEFEHACFFVASLIFWWPVVRPWPSHPRTSRWPVVPYLLVADLQNTVLSAILVFSDRVLYPSYTTMPRLFGLSAMQDQAASGAIMWVVGSLVFVIPAVAIAVQSLARSAHAPSVPLIAKAERSSRSFQSTQTRLAPNWLTRQTRARQLEAITFIVLFAAAAGSLAVLASKSSGDDDQTLRMKTTSGAFEVSVFAAQEILRGPNNFAVLVQDSLTGDVILDAAVELSAREQHRPQQARPLRASGGDSENKLLQSADIDFATAGAWLLSIAVRHGTDAAEFALPLQVAQPEHGFEFPWSWLWPLLLAATLAFIYLRRHERKPVIPRTIIAPAPEVGAHLELTPKER